MRNLFSLTIVVLIDCNQMTGCADETYICDDDGCYYCYSIGCRDADFNYPSCVFVYDCGEGSICYDYGCASECETDADCPEGPVCEHLAGVELHVGTIQSGNTSESLHESAGGQDRFGVDDHDATFLIHWSRATAMMMREPLAKFW